MQFTNAFFCNLDFYNNWRFITIQSKPFTDILILGKWKSEYAYFSIACWELGVYRGDRKISLVCIFFFDGDKKNLFKVLCLLR